MSKLKSCFLIAPIGKKNSDIRSRSDKLLKHVISPVCKECGFEVTRADKIAEPGMITNQIIERVINEDLVIADLTGHNANVFYELAIRHCSKKPAINIMCEGESIPFDNANSRTIFIDIQDLDSVSAAKKELAAQIKSVRDSNSQPDSPVDVAIDFLNMKNEGTASNEYIMKIYNKLTDLDAQLSDQRRQNRLLWPYLRKIGSGSSLLDKALFMEEGRMHAEDLGRWIKSVKQIKEDDAQEDDSN